MEGPRRADFSLSLSLSLSLSHTHTLSLTHTHTFSLTVERSWPSARAPPIEGDEPVLGSRVQGLGFRVKSGGFMV